MLLGTQKKILYPLIAFLATTLITSLVVYYSYKSQLKYSSALFNNLAQQQTENLSQVLTSDLHFIGAGANFFHATKPENWGQFHLFAEELVSSSDTLIGLQWMQRVEKQTLPEYLDKVRQSYPDFQLYTVPKDGPKTSGYIMPNDEDIYVATDIYPLSEANLKLLGFYSSRLRFQLILDGIRATGEPNVSDKVRLLQDGLDRTLEKTGLLVYHPVFDGNSSERLIGVVVGVIRTTRYFEGLIERTASGQQMLVKVTDLGFDAEDDPILYVSEGWESEAGLQVSKKIALPNREWMIDFKLASRVTNNDRIVLRSIGFGGLVIACLLGYIVFLQVREKEHLSILLDERTEELQFLVNHDSLTGLLNRRAFSEKLDELTKGDACFALAAFDIDKFKTLNDSFGHVAGDEMLIHVANTVAESLPEADLLYRMGGDEFCILSKNTDPTALSEQLNVIGQRVASSYHQYDVHQIQCSLSIGAAVRTTESAEDILKKADTQLYRSKKAGRNRVTVAE
ncbi:diguanylate cyclase [Vibrio variabilis]|uniref:diguanylate cyclase n=1 Tax=Vibrio variabilis TaxID=990271 RepID=A0ABR4YDQ6_9VIBR|nr:sensor domain-containing diguanylate cyclase [Vibrio variabilis]KHA61416.1 diguanylate cyclase [Vibrio variabilis]